MGLELQTSGGSLFWNHTYVVHFMASLHRPHIEFLRYNLDTVSHNNECQRTKLAQAEKKPVRKQTELSRRFKKGFDSHMIIVNPLSAQPIQARLTYLDTNETSSIQNLNISLKPLAGRYLKLWQTITEIYPCQQLSDFISVIPRINAKTLLSYVNKSIHKIKIQSCEVYLRRGSTNCRPI